MFREGVLVASKATATKARDWEREQRDQAKGYLERSSLDTGGRLVGTGGSGGRGGETGLCSSTVPTREARSQ